MDLRSFRVSGSRRFPVRVWFVSLILFFITLNIQAQESVVIQWPLTSDSVGRSASDLVRTGFSAGDAIGRVTFDAVYGAMAGGWDAEGLNPDAYYEYRVAPVSGARLEVHQLSLDVSLGRGEMNAVARYSTDGFRSEGQQIGQPVFFYTTTPYALTLPVNATVSHPDTLSIRIYAWNASDRMAEFNNRNVTISVFSFREVMQPFAVDAIWDQKENLPGNDSDGPMGTMGSQIFNMPGSDIWEVPPGVTCIKVECWGGGGRGGNLTDAGAAGGGGGGGYSRSDIPVNPGDNYTVNVGAGSTTSAPGGDSWFGNMTTVLAKGGNTVADNSPSGAMGGAGGIGDVTYQGGNGGNSVSGNSGGGGGGAGSNGAGGNATGITAGAGTSLYGGNGGPGINNVGNGNPGFSYGGGGSGEKRATGQDYLPGNGANGLIIVTYISSYDITPDNAGFCFGDIVSIGLSGSETGVTYQLYRDGNPIGGAVAGTGSELTFGEQTAIGTYSIEADLNNSTCILMMNGSVVIYALPACNISGPAGPVCPNAVNSYTGPAGMVSYAWSISGNGSISGSFTSQTLAVVAGSNNNETFTLTLNIEDDNGCSSICQKVVNVYDSQLPTITCPDDITQSTDEDACHAYVTTPDPIIGDNCAVALLTWVMTGATTGASALTGINYIGEHLFNVGETTVTYHLEDEAGNAVECSFLVTITDDQGPIVECVPEETRNTDPGACFYTAVGDEFDLADLFDNCTATDDLIVTNSMNGLTTLAGEEFPLGTTTVTWTVTDEAGNSSECSFLVTVEDNEAPSITCVASPQLRDTDPGECTYTTVGTEFDPVSVSDNCLALGELNVSNDINGLSTLEGWVFPLGTTTVTWTVNDGMGLMDQCSFLVIVTDNEDPVITCASDQTRDADNGLCTYTVPDNSLDPVYGDNCPVASVVNDYNGNSTLQGAVFPSGTTTVTWTVTDGSGNVNTCSHDLTITDGEPPTIIGCPGNVTVYTGPGSTVCGQNATWTPPTAIDNCGGPVTLVSTHNPGDFFPVGTTPVTYTATDPSGNQSLCTFNVIVIDDTPPTFTQPLDVTINVNSSCTYNAGVAITGDVTNENDNCPLGGAQATFNDVTVPGACPGTFVITRTWTLEDLHGNITVKVQIITVADKTAPILTVPANITVQCDESTLPANTGTATAVDNCGGPVTITYVDAVTPLACISEYNIIRSWTATDCSGNNKKGDQFIYVRDDIDPTIVNIDHISVPCPEDIPAPDPAVITATDNCSEVSIVFEYELTTFPPGVPGYCPSEIARYYKVSDVCGNYLMAVQIITITEPPTFCGCSPCLTSEAFYTVDLIGQPTGLIIIPNVTREDLCCDAELPTKCISFNVRIDDDAVGVEIKINGAAPVPHEWKIDCENVSIVDGIVCIPGGDFHLFTFCKPGSNANTYSFQSLAGIVMGNDLTTRINCNTEIEVSGSITDPEWNSISPGSYGQYNGYLSCTNCVDPIFQPDEDAPSIIEYQICGSLMNSPCVSGDSTICDTITLYVLDSIHVELNVDPGAYCQDAIPLLCATAYPEGTYSYTWYDNYDSTGNIVGTEQCYQPEFAGPYSLVVKYLDEDIPCSIFLFNFDVAPDDSPPEVFPPDSLFLECNDPANPQLIQDWLLLAYAVDDHTQDMDVDNDYAGIDQYCNSFVIVTFTAMDSCLNVGTATAVITILDTKAPSITCPPDVLVQADPITCEVEDPEIGSPVVTDECPGVITVTNDAPAAFPPGETLVTWTATDACGNDSSCTQKVTVIDLEPPSVECPPDVSVTADNNLCSADVIVPPPNVIDPCPYTVSHDSPYGIGPDNASGIYPVGSTTVTWTITGITNNITYCTQVITVTDDQFPTITCPPDVVAIAEPPECEVPDYELELPVIWDNCPDPVLTWEATGATPGSGTGYVSITTFNVGVTTITYTLTDASGNEVSCSFTVTINDEVPPTVITCPPDQTVTVPEDACEVYVTVPAPEVEDPCGEIVTTSHDSPYGISPEDASGTYPAGVYLITWTFTDESGNISTCEQTITVIDDQFPTITCPEDVVAIAEPPECEVPEIIVEDPETNDNCPDPELTWEKEGATVGTGTGLVNNTPFNVGVTLVTYTITDASGNSASCTFTVTVNDEVPPTVITCPPDQTVTVPEDACEIYVTVPAPEVEDPCGEIVTTSHDSPYGISPEDASGIYPVGEYLVTWTFTDESGNTSECLQKITVLDETDPLLDCPDSFEWPADFNQTYASDVPVDPPVYSDNCAVVTLTWEMTGATVGNSPATGINVVTVYTFNVGVTTIVYTATDPSGNTVTCEFTVTITSAPEIECPENLSAFTDPGVCSALLDPGVPVLLSGVEPIEWDWTMTGATVDNGTGTPIVPNPYPFNEGTTLIRWIATNESGADTCYQEIVVTDNEPPSFTLPQDSVFYCANNIITGVYNFFPTPGIIPEYDDITEPRPEYYLFEAGSTIFDLDPVINEFFDNCCEDNALIIHWRIDFSPTPNPATAAHEPIDWPDIPLQTGQPSAYGEIRFPADGVYFTNTEHYLYYSLEDCNGNVSGEQMLTIIIGPRPNVIKQ